MVGAVRIGHERQGKPKIARAVTAPGGEGRPNKRPGARDAAGSLGLGACAPGAAEKPLERMFALCPTDPADEYMPIRRSIRLHGHSTTIRLERAFWMVLEELAAKEGSTLAALITKIYDHCLGTDQKNLASCLRVVSLKYIEICS